jgi:hypothetical protein
MLLLTQQPDRRGCFLFAACGAENRCLEKGRGPASAISHACDRMQMHACCMRPASKLRSIVIMHRTIMMDDG